MAKQKNNVVTHGLSGKVGGILVFRQRAGQTVVSKVPEKSSRESDAQKAQRRKFQRAILYSNMAASDPELSSAYSSKAKPGQTLRNVAVADFMHAPDIETIDLTGYHGKPGDVIRIEVTDDFAVREVRVVITNADGSPVEEGNAVQGAMMYEWTYKATSENISPEGDRIEIIASDTPGNISVRSEEM